MLGARKIFEASVSLQEPYCLRGYRRLFEALFVDFQLRPFDKISAVETTDIMGIQSLIDVLVACQ